MKLSIGLRSISIAKLWIDWIGLDWQPWFRYIDIYSDDVISGGDDDKIKIAKLLNPEIKQNGGVL